MSFFSCIGLDTIRNVIVSNHSNGTGLLRIFIKSITKLSILTASYLVCITDHYLKDPKAIFVIIMLQLVNIN